MRWTLALFLVEPTEMGPARLDGVPAERIAGM